MSPRSKVVALGVLAALACSGAWPSPVHAVERHAGTVVKVDPQANVLVLEELAALGKKQEIRVKVQAQTRLVLSERIPDSEVTDPAHPFKDTAIRLSDVRPGDFVVVEVTREGQAPVASAVTVTFRGGSK